MIDRAVLAGERFQELADAAPAMLWRIDASFESDWANKSWFDFTGGTLEEERGFAWADRIHPEDRERVLEEFDRAFEAREPTSVEFRLKGRDGRYRWLLDSGAPFFRDGAFAGFVGSCVDVTERKEAELRTQRLQHELIRLSRAEAINSLASGIVHELGQPLQSIESYAAGLERKLAAGAGDVGHLPQIAGAIREAAARANFIVRNCRSLAAGSNGERSRADLATVLKGAEPLIRAHRDARNVTVDWDLAPGLEAEISAVEIQQVLFSLCANAFEAMREAPVRRLRIKAAAWGALAIVSIADTGRGIRKDLGARIFDTLVSTKSDGMGVGLFVCRAIVSAHGGRIWAEAAPQGGATFKFTLPLAP